jgi:hypothetical protein
MDKTQVIQKLEDDINFLHKAEDRIKQNSLKIRTINDEIRELRELRDKTAEKNAELIEECKRIAIDFETLDKAIQ